MTATRNLLWLIIVLILVETVAREFVPSVWLTVFHVVAMVAFALIHGALRYGWRGIVAFIVICLVVSNIFENLSILTGFPFGHYHYTDVLGPKLFLVPLLIGPAYFGVGYISWVLGTILVGDVRRRADGLATFAAPFVAAFIMVLWDLTFDPGASTNAGWWIWENGGGYFGVPLSNYLGWYFTVYLFLQLFALYLRAYAPDPERPQPKSWSYQAIALYAVTALAFILDYVVTRPDRTVTDATGKIWHTADMYETAIIVSLLTMGFVVAATWMKVAREK